MQWMRFAGKNHPHPGQSTIAYEAPELVQFTGPESPHGVPDTFEFKPQDMWSMGCLLLEMLVNANPFLKMTGVVTEALKRDPLPTINELRRLTVQSRHAEWVRHESS